MDLDRYITNTPRAGETPEQIAARMNRQVNIQTQVTNYPGGSMTTVLPPKDLVRTFGTGATRDTDEGKLDFEGFLSPLVLEAFAKYMHDKRKMPDGSLRDSDNWQKGIGRAVYMKSMWRHFFAVWQHQRNGEPSVEELCALLFNVQGMLHEVLLDRDAA